MLLRRHVVIMHIFDSYAAVRLSLQSNNYTEPDVKSIVQN